MSSKLEFSFNSNKLGEFILDKEVMTIGRKDDNDICIENLAVSGHHAKLLTIFDDSFLEDLSSTNGTFVNGKSIDKHPLKNGDVIVIGKHELRYVNESHRINNDSDKTVLIHRKPEPTLVHNTVASLDNTIPFTGSRSSLPNKTEIKPAEMNLESATLQLLNGKSAGKQLGLLKPSVKLGRSGAEVIQINRRPDGHFIVCLDVPSGCKSPKVNGEDIGARSVKLENHDVIEINRIKIEYYLAGHSTDARFL